MFAPHYAVFINVDMLPVLWVKLKSGGTIFSSWCGNLKKPTYILSILESLSYFAVLFLDILHRSKSLEQYKNPTGGPAQAIERNRRNFEQKNQNLPYNGNNFVATDSVLDIDVASQEILKWSKHVSVKLHKACWSFLSLKCNLHCNEPALQI